MRLLTYLTLVAGLSVCTSLEGQVYLIAGTPLTTFRSHMLPNCYKSIQKDMPRRSRIFCPAETEWIG